MRRLQGTLVLVALVAFGGLAGLWIRRQAATAGPERTGAGRWTHDQTSPKAASPEVSRASAPPVRRPDPKASLVVRLRSSGKPVPGMAFTILEEATHQQEKFTTGPDGAHGIQGLPAGEYHLAVDHPDYVYATAHRIIEADKAHEVVIDLDRGGRLEGKVTDTAGRPLEGTHVFFVDAKGLPVGHNLEADTDASGEYKIPSIPVGLYDVRFRHPSYRAARKENLAVNGKGQEFRIDMVLLAGQSISGKVVNQDGVPIPAAIIVGSNEETSTARSDAEGAFSLLGLGDGPASCFASAPGYGPVYLKGLAPGSAGVEFRLSKAAEVLGRINTQPVPDRFSVRVSRFEPDLGSYVPLYTRSFEGNLGDDFRMTELPAGRYRLEVEASGYETQDIPELELSAGQTLTGVQVRLRKTS
jgi:carboxypeptidase family protein